jgi:SAM-dependent methyltransferase
MVRNAPLDFLGVSLDTQTIPQERLNIADKERSNLFPWNGQFSPQLVEALLQTYARPGNFVLDPFLGSGTVLYEAGLCGLPAFGSEINPAAFKMASTYTLINVKPGKRRLALEAMDALLGDLTPDAAPLFALSRAYDPRPLCQVLPDHAAAASDPHVRLLLEALIVRLNAGEKELDQRTIDATWGRIRDVVAALPFSEAPVEPTNCDARALPLSVGRVDLVITSPPYINVFNYHQQYRKSVELLGWDLLEVAKSEIGSNRKHRGNRFLTVTQYCLDMVAVLEELRRVCKPTARIVLVVGRESNVRKTRFLNGEIVANLAVRSAGFHFEARQERVFQNRFGEMIYEDILHFIPQPANGRPLTPPAAIARGLLTAALEWAPTEALEDLHDALARVDEVAPSPLYRQSATAPPLPARRVV